TRALEQAIAGTVVDAVTARVRKQNDLWVWFESNVSPIFGTAGKAHYLSAPAPDGTEREELRARIAELDALYRVAEAVGGSATLDELLEESIEALLHATTADRAAVLLYDDERV